jgi:predicted HicB family RNase H-like nuclease
LPSLILSHKKEYIIYLQRIKHEYFVIARILTKKYQHVILLEERITMEKAASRVYRGEKKNRKQLGFDIHPDIHTEIKILAAKKGISISYLIACAINEFLRREKLNDEKIQ